MTLTGPYVLVLKVFGACDGTDPMKLAVANTYLAAPACPPVPGIAEHIQAMVDIPFPTIPVVRRGTLDGTVCLKDIQDIPCRVPTGAGNVANHLLAADDSIDLGGRQHLVVRHLGNVDGGEVGGGRHNAATQGQKRQGDESGCCELFHGGSPSAQSAL